MLAALALGCAGGRSSPEISPARFLEAEEAIGFEALSSVGPVPHAGTVRAINRFGAAVPSPATEQITANNRPITVQFDGYGYGAIPVTQPGTVTLGGAIGPGESGPVELFGVASDWPQPLMQRAWALPLQARPEHAGAIHTGGVAAIGAEVWWAGEGAAPHRVLLAESEVLGLQAANIDLDGVGDALAWTEETVFLLRGRPGGGLAWGAALEAQGYQVASADVGDLSGDNLPDIAIAWRDPSGEGLLDVLEGDGLFRFTLAEPREIPGDPSSLAVGDHTGEGLAQVTVLHTDGTWSRFIRGAELQYMPIGPAAPAALDLPEGSMLLPASIGARGDTNGDGASEIAVAGPRSDGQPRNLWFVDVATQALECSLTPDDPDLQCSTEFLPLENEPAPYPAVVDGNGDFLDDIFLAREDLALFAVARNHESDLSKFGKLKLMDLPAYGPIDLLDFDRDGGMDLLMAAGPVWWRWLGQGYEGLDRFWAPLPSPLQVVREGLVPPFALAELDQDDDTVEIVAFAVEGGETSLRVLRYTRGESRADVLGEITVDEQGRAPDDLAVCGVDAYAVVGGQVMRILLSNPASPSAPVRAGEDATRVDCGEAPNNADVAVLEGGDIQLRVRGSLAPAGAPSPANAYDLAIGDLGAGPEVATCETEGCSIVWWDSVFAIGDAQGITVVDARGVERSIGGAGWLLVTEVDGEGHPDLVGLASGGLVSLHRSTGDGIAPAELFHTELGWAGSIGVLDGDGDGHADFWGISPQGDLAFVRSQLPVASE